jgi:hypothetical protein
LYKMNTFISTHKKNANYEKMNMFKDELSLVHKNI